MRKTRGKRQLSRQPAWTFCPSPARPARRGFTLTEVLVAISISSIVISIGLLSFRDATRSNVLAQARNAVVTYAKVARSYAVANRIETLLVVNPFNGRFEIWHVNPPVQGGEWDPQSSGTETSEPWKTDGYAFAPVLDSSARLPVDGKGRPVAAVFPIDYDYTRGERPAAVTDTYERDLDNLTWAAFCFDENGRLVIRTRRIATRTYRVRDGRNRAGASLPPGLDVPNRLVDESPDLTRQPLVDLNDTPITSSQGFVISDTKRMTPVLNALGLDPDRLVRPLIDNWLMLTREGMQFDGFAETVILNRHSGQELLGAS